MSKDLDPPDASPCNGDGHHRITPWSRPAFLEDDYGRPTAIQYAECCRCGLVITSQIAGDPDQIRDSIARAIHLQRAMRVPGVLPEPDAPP